MAFKRSFKKRAAPKRRAYKRKTMAKKPLKRLIRQVIQKAAEKKVSFNHDFDLNVVSSGNTGAAALIIPACPTSAGFEIQQGISQDERIGNRIRVVNATIKGTIFPKPYNATFNATPKPVLVQMFVYWDKANPNVAPDPFGANNFFQLGSTSEDFNNHVIDTWLPINKDRWSVVHRQTFKVGTAAFEGTGINAGAQAFTNNDFKFNCPFSLNLTKHMVRNVRYNDNDIDATTRGLYVMWVACNADGSTLGATTIPATVSYALDMTYTDL